MKKYPLVITYKDFGEGGKELRYALRSIKNINNFNGEVFIVGDCPKWVKNVTHIESQRSPHPYIDQELLMMAAINDPRVADDFIYSMDDVYVTEPTEIINWHQGEYIRQPNQIGYHHNQKQVTKEWLRKNRYTTLDYELHAPMILNKEKRTYINSLFKKNIRGVVMKPRTLYGNIFNIGGEYMEDKKTRTKSLPKGAIISTQYYTDELDKLFNRKGKHEI